MAKQTHKLYETEDIFDLYNRILNILDHYHAPVHIIDVRGVDDFKKAHIMHAVHISLNTYSRDDITCYLRQHFETQKEEDSALFNDIHKGSAWDMEQEEDIKTDAEVVVVEELFCIYHDIPHVNDDALQNISALCDVIHEEYNDIEPNTGNILSFRVLSTTFAEFHNMYPFLCETFDDVTKNKETHIISYPNSILSNHLYLGNAYHASMHQICQDLGITHIINVTKYAKCHFDTNSEIKYLQIKVNDIFTETIDQYFDKVHRFINKALYDVEIINSNPFNIGNITEIENRTILIHCQAGISRSATMVISYLMKEKHMRLNAAKEFVSNKRPIISPNSGFMKQLKQYEIELFGRNMVDCPDINYHEDTQMKSIRNDTCAFL